MPERNARFSDLLEYPLRSGVTVAKDRRGNGIAMVNMGELFRYSRIGTVDMARVTIDATNEDRYLLREGDLLFARRSLKVEGAGQCSIILEVREPTTWESSIIRARLDPALADPRFYFYYFRSPIGRASVENIVEQVAASGIRSSDLGNLLVPWPTVEYQHSVADILSRLDNKIAINEQIATTCHELAQSELMGAKGNFIAVPLRQVADIVMGSSPPGDTYNRIGDGLPFYQGIRDFGFRHPSVRVWCSNPVRTANSGDTLLSVRAPVGRVNIAQETSCIGRGVAAISSDSRRASLIFHTLSSAHDLWLPYEAEGTVFGAINKKQLADLPTLWPQTREEEVSLNEALTALDSRVTAATKESGILAELRDTLLPKLISGELRIRDAEKVVEDAV